MMKKHRLISLLALFLAMQCLVMPMQAMAQGTGGSGEGAQENSAPTPDTVPQGTEPTPGDPTGGETPTGTPDTGNTPDPGGTLEPGGTPEGPATPTPTPDSLPSATPTMTPGQSPTPSPELTPTPVLTPTPIPSPTLTPVPGVKLSGEDVQLILGREFDPMQGIAAVDELGNPVAVKLVDDGGFNGRQVGDYTLRYQAVHPVTGQVYTLTRVVHVYKSPDQEKYKVTIMAGELVLKVGGEYDLLKDVKAVDENGDTVEYGVYDRSGFMVSRAGTYTVVIGAIHPVTGELFTQERTVRVLTEEEYKDWERAQRRLSGDSNERYARYLQYRNEIYEKLQVQMMDLTSQLQARIHMLQTVFPDMTLELVAYTPNLVDDSGMDAAMADADAAEAYYYPVGEQDYTPMQSLHISNWSDILAVFVTSESLDVAQPLDLMNLRKIDLSGLSYVFWDMNQLTYHQEGDTLRVMLTPRSASEMARHYGWDADREMVLEELMQPEFLKVFASLTGDTSFDDMSEEEAQAIRDSLPEGLDVQREAIVMTASSLVGKVSYFWGGKYNEMGWNPLWGIPRRVTSEGSVTTGKVRNYGLDCSGFVAWTFINAIGDPAVLEAIGNGSANQWARSTSLGWDEAQPGDLAFRAKPGSVDINHVGIVLNKTQDGQYMIVHCSSKENGVVVTEAWSSGFRYFRRPALYQEEVDAQ